MCHIKKKDQRDRAIEDTDIHTHAHTQKGLFACFYT
jgi:hypothetical protein